MANRNLAHDVAVVCFSHPMQMDGKRLRGLYEWIVASFTHQDKVPNSFLAEGAGFSGKTYLDYARGRKRLEAVDFQELLQLGCGLFKEQRNANTIGWKFDARSIKKRVALHGGEGRWEPTGWWEVTLITFPSFLDVTEDSCVDLALELARRTVEEYGSVFLMHRNRGPEYYLIGMDYEAMLYPNDRTYDEGANITGWSTDPSRRLARPWLRDVYPRNFLGPRLAAMPMEDKPLVEWLRADPSRGIVEPFPCDRERNVVLWRPPVEQIPVLRERLYRAGLIWHREYNYGSFTPQDPPPEIMRAEFYDAWDPKLTR